MIAFAPSLAPRLGAVFLLVAGAAGCVQCGERFSYGWEKLALFGPAVLHCQECRLDYQGHCEGDDRVGCGGGPDDSWPDRWRERCDQPSPRCVDATYDDGSSRGALCVAEPVTRCDRSHVSHCEGDVVYACEAGYVRATDCSRLEDSAGRRYACVARPGGRGAWCQPTT